MKTPTLEELKETIKEIGLAEQLIKFANDLAAEFENKERRLEVLKQYNQGLELYVLDIAEKAHAIGLREGQQQKAEEIKEKVEKMYKELVQIGSREKDPLTPVYNKGYAMGQTLVYSKVLQALTGKEEKAPAPLSVEKEI